MLLFPRLIGASNLLIPILTDFSLLLSTTSAEEPGYWVRYIDFR